MAIKVILATDGAGVLGWSDGRLAYPGLKRDMARFKALTVGHPVFMGNSTFKSLGRPEGLPHRKNIVLSRSKTEGQAVEYVSSLDYLQRFSKNNPDIWVIGGASVYDAVLEKNMADEIFLTLVASSSEADVKISTNVFDWKRFVLAQAQKQIFWRSEIQGTQWDGDIETSYIRLEKE